MKKFFKYIWSGDYNRVIITGFTVILLINIYAIISVDPSLLTFILQMSTFMGFFLIFLYNKKSQDSNVTSSTGSNDNNKKFFGFINFIDDKFKNFLKEVDDIERKYADPQDIKRENKTPLLLRLEHRQKIMEEIKKLFHRNDLRGLIVTGESGTGKSTLLRLLKGNIEREGLKSKFTDRYVCDKEFPEANPEIKTVYIFDQFEKEIKLNVIKKWLLGFNGDYSNAVFVFSFPQNYISRMYKWFSTFNSAFYLSTYVLYVNDDDADDYLNKIVEVTAHEGEGIDNYKEYMTNPDLIPQEQSNKRALLLKLNQVKNGEAPLIEMEFLGSCVELMRQSSSYTLTSENFKEQYFNYWASRFSNPETAYVILNLFTRYESYSIFDIKRITFENDKSLGNWESFIDLLSSSPFLLKIPPLDACDDHSSFKPKHEYISNEIQKYLASKNIPIGAKQFTEFYRKIIDDNNSNDNFAKAIDKQYNEYHDTRTKLNVCTILMIVAIGAFCLVKTYLGESSFETIFHRVIFTFVAAPSILYIYNYCDRIFYAKGSKYASATCFFGVFSIIISYIFPLGWGIFLGFEICILAVSIRCYLAKGTDSEAYKVLRHDYIQFFSIGIAIIILGVIFEGYFLNLNSMDFLDYLLKYSYYALFVAYSCMSCFAHIRYYYTIDRIGYLNMINMDKG